MFVTKRARNFLAGIYYHSTFFFFLTRRKGLLGKSRFAGDIPLIEKCFDKTTKLSFRNAEEPQFIRFGTTRDTEPSLKIRSGQLRLLGCVPTFLFFVGSTCVVEGYFSRSDLASFFEPSLQCIVKAINEQSASSSTKISVSLDELFQIL